MCSTCGADFYGQDQSAARKADVERLKRVKASRDAKTKGKN